VLDVLECGFRDDIAVRAFLLRVAEKAERESPVGEPPTIAMSDGLGSVKRVVLPSTVRVGSPENLFRPLQLLGALNQSDRRASAGVEPVPEGLVLGDLIPGELIRFIDQACISHSERPIPEIRHAIVTKSVDVIDVEPVMIHGEKIIACQLAIEVSALAEIAEVVLREGSHARIIALRE